MSNTPNSTYTLSKTVQSDYPVSRLSPMGLEIPAAPLDEGS